MLEKTDERARATWQVIIGMLRRSAEQEKLEEWSRSCGWSSTVTQVYRRTEREQLLRDAVRVMVRLLAQEADAFFVVERHGPAESLSGGEKRWRAY